jgi:hypothetical protein
VGRGNPHKALDAFYQTHIPRLLALDCYEWGRRYYSRPDDEETPVAHLAVYEFVGEENIVGNLGAPSDSMPELVKKEVASWAELSDVTDVAVSIFDQRAGPHFPGPMMSLDTPIGVAYAAAAENRKDELEQFFNQPANPTSLGAGYLSLLRFRRHEHPAFAHPPASNYISVAHVDDERPAASSLGVPPELLEAQSVREVMHPVAKHWKPW